VTDDAYLRFARATIDGRFRLLSDPATADELQSRLGADVVAEYRSLAASGPGQDAVLGDRPPNLIFVPGVMGSLLASQGLSGVWWIDLRELRRLDSLGLDTDGTRDAVPGADITAIGVEHSYAAFLQAAWERDDFGHRTYPYDWRKPIPEVTAGLRDAVRAAHAANGGEPVHLIAHSMGGLVIRATLMRHPDLWDLVGRIVFIATPHYGSPAIAGYLKNHLWGFDFLVVLGRLLSRQTFRSLWGVLDLLPAPAGVYPGTREDPDPARHPCANFDLYDAAAYELRLGPAEQARLQSALDAAAAFHRDLRQWHRGLPQDRRDRMAVIAGVGYRTLFRLAYKKHFGVAWEYMDRVTSRQPGDPNREGDGRVPLASAELEDTGTIRYVAGKHGDLPSIPAVWSDAFSWLAGSRLNLPQTPQAALSARLDGDTIPAGTALLAVHGPAQAPDDPGYLEVTSPGEAALTEIEEALAAGELPEFTRVRLL
jgi:pimeloyl-ACP methyl ester carboxylesterase